MEVKHLFIMYKLYQGTKILSTELDPLSKNTYT